MKAPREKAVKAKHLKRFLGYIWAFPVTAVGLLFAILASMSGGSIRVQNGVIAAYGGVVGLLLRLGGFRLGGAAMTLGHVVLARNAECLFRSWDHEMVHVRQYERWGAFLLPVYWLVSFVLWFRGYHPYLDNPFEPPAAEGDTLEH